MRNHQDPFIDPGPPADALAEERWADLEERKERALQEKMEYTREEVDGGEYDEELAVAIGNVDEIELAVALRELFVNGDSTSAVKVYDDIREVAAKCAAERRLKGEG